MSSSCDSNPSWASVSEGGTLVPPCPLSFSFTASVLQFDGVTYSAHFLLRLGPRLSRSFDKDLANVARASERSLAALADRLQHGIDRVRQLRLHFDVAN